jgi:hypothetical protein
MPQFDTVCVLPIDASPSPWVPADMAIALEEPELRAAQAYQFERFWRVWHVERDPKITHLTLVLRGERLKDGTYELSGINRFLSYFDCNCSHICNRMTIWLDEWSCLKRDERWGILDAPLLLLQC